VQELTLEVMQAWNVWPFPIVQGTSCLDQNVTLVTLNGAAIDISDLMWLASAVFQFI
jgi:hypothetical protein